MKPKSNAFLRASRFALIAITLTASVQAGTTWDGKKNDDSSTSDTFINTAENWDDDALPVFDGTASVKFTGGTTAVVNAASYFNAMTFDNPAGFDLASGAGTLSIKGGAGSSNTANVLIATNTGFNQTISAPLKVNTTGTILNIFNSNAPLTGYGLDLTGGLGPVSGTTAIGFRLSGTGTTRIGGTITSLGSIAQSSTGSGFDGTFLIDASVAMGAATVNFSTTGTTGANARIQMGTSTLQTQSWASTTINKNATIIVNSTATLSSNVGIATATGATGATLIVNGSLTSASTLNIGTTGVTGNLKIGGSASFTGGVTIGAAAGNLIVGNNAATNGTLSLSSGTISANATIGGLGENENKLNLTKINGGLLTVNGTHTYTGATTVNAGTLTLGGSIASAATVNSGGLLNVNGSTSAPVTVNASGSVGGTGTIGNTLTFGLGNSTLNYALTGPLNATSVDVSNATAVVVSPAAAPTNGTSYVALKRSTGTFDTTDFNKFTLATRGGALTLTGGATEITITPAASDAASLVWKGNVSSAWEASPVQNWTKDGSPDRFYTDDSVTFDDTATSFAISISGTSVTPGNMVFDNTIGKDYTISGGTIGGAGSLTKKSSGTVTLTQSGTNAFSGALNLEAGVLSISNLNQIGGGSSTRAVTLKGGTLQYTGTTQTTDALPLVLDSGSSTIDVTIGGTNTLRFGAATTGSGNLVKTGNGILALGKNGSNAAGSTPDPKTSGSTFTGTVTVNAGSLEVRNPDSLGAYGALQGTSVNNASLIIFPYGQNQGITASPEPLAISGTSYFITANQDADTDITNEWTGNVTVADNAIVGLGSPKYSTSTNVSKFVISGAVTTNAGSVLNFGQNSATVSSNIQEIDVTGALSGPASVTARGAAGSLYTLADPEYAGNTTVNSATLSLGADNSSNNASTVTIAATGATLDLNFAGIDTVDKLFIGGVQQNAGDYTIAHASGVFTGSGTLRVTSNPSGFTAWANANGATGQTVAQDHDNDGVDNGVEYFLGATGSSFTTLPGVQANTVTWVKGGSYVGSFGTGFKVQSSTNLTTWIDATSSGTPGVPNTVYLSSNNVTYTLPTGAGKTFVRLLVNPD